MAKSEHILIVDDDSFSRRLLCRALGDHGFEAVECEDGMEALQVLEANGGALLVLDYDMPELNGAQICEVIRTHKRPEISATPIILLTAHSNSDHEVECLNAGANDFVTKPVNMAVLRARIETHLRLHDLRQQLEENNRELQRWRTAHERDLEAARLTQQAILPQRMPRLTGWEFAAEYQPLIQVGGDIYDWLPLPGGKLLVWIADATGHGASAALITTLTKWLFQSGASEASSPAEILQSVGGNFHGVFKGGSFMTAAVLVLDPISGLVTFSGAGHPPLLIVRANGEVESLASASPPLGIDGGKHATEVAATLHAGDAFLLYTDGLYTGTTPAGERLNAAELPGLITPPASAQALVAETIAAGTASMGGASITDDLAAFAGMRRH